MNFHPTFSLPRQALCPRCNVRLEAFNAYFLHDTAFCKDCYDLSERETQKVYVPTGGPQPERIAHQLATIIQQRHTAFSRGILFFVPQQTPPHPVPLLVEIGDLNWVYS